MTFHDARPPDEHLPVPSSDMALEMIRPRMGVLDLSLAAPQLADSFDGLLEAVDRDFLAAGFIQPWISLSTLLLLGAHVRFFTPEGLAASEKLLRNARPEPQRAADGPADDVRAACAWTARHELCLALLAMNLTRHVSPDGGVDWATAHLAPVQRRFVSGLLVTPVGRLAQHRCLLAGDWLSTGRALPPFPSRLVQAPLGVPLRGSG